MVRRSPRASDEQANRGKEQLAGLHVALEAIRARRRKLWVLRVQRGLQRPELAAVVAEAKAAGIRVEPVSEERLAELAAGVANSQGVVLEAGPLPELSLGALLESIPDQARTLVALDGVEDPQNLGAIARVVEGCGAAGLILPRRRSAPLSAAAARASAGAIEWLPCARVPNLPRALNILKSEGFWIFGSDPSAEVELYSLPERSLEGKRVVVFGAEGRGLRRGVDRVLDFRVRIALEGQVASLNVAAAAAVFLFELRRRS